MISIHRLNPGRSLLILLAAFFLAATMITGPFFSGRVLAAVPAIASAVYNMTAGTLTVTGANFIANPSGPDIDASCFTVIGEITDEQNYHSAPYTLTDTPDAEISSDTQFTLVLSAADKTNVDSRMHKYIYNYSGGYPYTLNYSNGWMPGAAAEGNFPGSCGLDATNVPRPTITSVTYDGATGVFHLTGSWRLNDIMYPIQSIITGGANESYHLNDDPSYGPLYRDTSTTDFSFTIDDVDKPNVNGLLNKTGTVSGQGTPYNFAALTQWVPFNGDPDDDISDMTNPITVTSTVFPSLTSAVYYPARGEFVVSGVNLLKKQGVDNDVNISCFTITGQGGSYTVTSPVKVEEFFNTFSFTLTGADLAAVNALLDNGGTASSGGIPYNLSAANGWIAAADPAVVTTDPTCPVTVYDNQPKITSAEYNPIAGTMTVTGLNFQSKPGSNNDVDASMFSIAGEGLQSYRLQHTADVELTGSTSFTLALHTLDRFALITLLNKNGTTSTGGALYNLAADSNWNPGASPNCPPDLSNNIITVTGLITGGPPTITSATYNAVHGTFIVTGTGFQMVPGSDINLGKLTVTGDAGQTVSIIHSGYGEFTSPTSFSIGLSSADKYYLNAVLNNNGTTSKNGAVYNIAAADGWTISTSGTSSADLTGNPITVSGVDPPLIDSATYDINTGVLTVTGSSIQRNFPTSSIRDIDASKFTITGQGGQSYTLTDTTDVDISKSIMFALTLSVTDKNAVNALLNKNGTSSGDGTVYNLSAAAGWNTYPLIAVPADTTGNPIAVSGVSGASLPSIISAIYDVSTGTLTVTGVNLVAMNGSNNDIDVSKMTITGEGGIKFTLTDTPDVDITSSSQFTIVLSPNDKTSLQPLLNKNGARSNDLTYYYLAAAEGWNPGAGSNSVADMVNNNITVSGVGGVFAPSITSALYNSATGQLIVTGTDFNTASGSNNDIDASQLSITGEGNQTYRLTNTPDVDITSSTSFTLTLSATDKNNIITLLNKNGTSSAGGTTYNLAAASIWNRGAASSDDLTGNPITVSGITIPVIISAQYNAAAGQLTVTGTDFTAASGSANDVRSSAFTIAGEGGEIYTLSTTPYAEITNSTSFTITLSDIDKNAVAMILNKTGLSSTGGAIYNLAAASHWMTAAPEASDITGNPVTVTDVSVPVITFAAFSPITGMLEVSGNGFKKLSGANNDIDVSKLTVYGKGGKAYTLTTGSVDITSGSAFIVVLSAADKAAVVLLFDREGTSASDDTVYNLAAAEDWARGADASVTVRDAATPVTVAHGTPEMDIYCNGSIFDMYGIYDFGTVHINTRVTVTFIIKNSGDAPLVLQTPLVIGSYTNILTITQQPQTMVIPGGQTSFTVSLYSKTDPMYFSSGLSIWNNDHDEGYFSMQFGGFITEKEVDTTNGSSETVSDNQGNASLSGNILEDGVFTAKTIVNSRDENLALTFSTGSRGLDKNSNPLENISILPAVEPPAPPQGSSIARVYELGPEGAVFNPGILLSIAYDPSRLPAGINEADLKLAWYNPAAQAWIELNSTVNTNTHTVNANITHFSLYAIIVKGETLPPETIPAVVQTTPGSTTTTMLVPVPTTPLLTATTWQPVPVPSTSIVTETQTVVVSLTPPPAPPASTPNWVLMGSIIGGVIVVAVIILVVMRGRRY